MSDDLWQVSSSKDGPWAGSFSSREAIAEDAPDLDGEHVCYLLDDEGGQSDWFIRWPDGRIEQVTYEGDHVGFLELGDADEE